MEFWKRKMRNKFKTFHRNDYLIFACSFVFLTNRRCECGNISESCTCPCICPFLCMRLKSSSVRWKIWHKLNNIDFILHKNYNYCVCFLRCLFLLPNGVFSLLSQDCNKIRAYPQYDAVRKREEEYVR